MGNVNKLPFIFSVCPIINITLILIKADHVNKHCSWNPNNVIPMHKNLMTSNQWWADRNKKLQVVPFIEYLFAINAVNIKNKI